MTERECAMYGCSETQIPADQPICPVHASVLTRDLRDLIHRTFNRYAPNDAQSSGFVSAVAKACSWLRKALEADPPRGKPSWDSLKRATRARDASRGMLFCELHDVSFSPRKACPKCAGKSTRTTSTGVQLKLV